MILKSKCDQLNWEKIAERKLNKIDKLYQCKNMIL